MRYQPIRFVQKFALFEETGRLCLRSVMAAEVCDLLIARDDRPVCADGQSGERS
jgi:hypothetical protein